MRAQPKTVKKVKKALYYYTIGNFDALCVEPIHDNDIFGDLPLLIHERGLHHLR
jgi:hypothetical protein